MNENGFIGVFDSGVGGLTIWSEIVKQYPLESTLYVADNAHCPYGPRSQEEIIALSTHITQFLLAQGCKIIVVACNTASAAALKSLRSQFSVPIVGMEPAIKPAALASKTGHIGILATKGTLQGSLFKETSQRYANGVIIHQQVAQGLVSLIEDGHLSGKAVEDLLYQYLRPMLVANVDQLVLGCTHYPFLTPVIKQIVGTTMHIINPAEAVARQVGRLLKDYGQIATLNKTPEHHFYSSDKPNTLKQLLAFLDYPNVNVTQLMQNAE